MAIVPIQLKRGIGAPPVLIDGEPAVDGTPGAPKLWVGIGGVPTVLADMSLINTLIARIDTLEARIVVLESCIWGIA